MFYTNVLNGKSVREAAGWFYDLQYILRTIFPFLIDSKQFFIATLVLIIIDFPPKYAVTN